MMTFLLDQRPTVDSALPFEAAQLRIPPGIQSSHSILKKPRAQSDIMTCFSVQNDKKSELKYTLILCHFKLVILKLPLFMKYWVSSICFNYCFCIFMIKVYKLNHGVRSLSRIIHKMLAFLLARMRSTFTISRITHIFGGC